MTQEEFDEICNIVLNAEDGLDAVMKLQYQFSMFYSKELN